jgi:hypothetical protein
MRYIERTQKNFIQTIGRRHGIHSLDELSNQCISDPN